jgi:hypothetical protein
VGAGEAISIPSRLLQGPYSTCTSMYSSEFASYFTVCAKGRPRSKHCSIVPIGSPYYYCRWPTGKVVSSADDLSRNEADQLQRSAIVDPNLQSCLNTRSVSDLQCGGVNDILDVETKLCRPQNLQCNHLASVRGVLSCQIY